MKKTILIIIAFYYVGAYSQDINNFYYNSKNGKTNLLININTFYLSSRIKIKNILEAQNIEILKNNELNNNGSFFYIVNVKDIDNIDKYNAFISKFVELEYIDNIQPVIGDEYPIACSEFFYIKVKDENNLNKINNLLKENNCLIQGKIPTFEDWYKVKVLKQKYKTKIDICNMLYETNLADKIDYGFMFNFTNTCVNDPLFNQQWALYNSLNQSVDINACQVWNITKGDNVKVAVLDQGIDLTHSEFSNTISNISFDAQSNTAPSHMYGIHATHVAGIIGANQNSNLISGVAPNCNLISISHSLSLTPNISLELATGINWARQNNIQVINNSWGDQGGSYYNNLQSTLLEEAIDNALLLGRDGLGMVVVFASGNFSPVIDYPASYTSDILCVGSIDQSGEKSSFSGYGAKLDVVAPGRDVLSTLPYNSTGFLSGTSMAAPHAAGLAALILAINPCLTNIEVNELIEKNAQHVGGYTFTNGRNDKIGYGLIDAYKSVQEALSPFLLQDNTENGNLLVASGEVIRAGDHVNSSLANGPYVVNATADVEFKATKTITLEDGFTAKAGSNFLAHIKPFTNCDSWNSKSLWFKDSSITNNKTINFSKENTKNVKYKLFPNPFTNILYLEYELDESETVSLTLYNILGKEIYSKTINGQKGNNMFKIDLLTESKIVLTKICIGENCETTKLIRK